MNRKHEIGDVVIAINTKKAPSQKRVKGQSYTVTDVMYCETNGDQLVNIDNTPSVGSSNQINCACGKRHKLNESLGYTYSIYFINIKNLDAELKEALEQENYDIAIIIREYQRANVSTAGN